MTRSSSTFPAISRSPRAPARRSRASRSVTSAEGQWLALDPFGARTGTLGATIATGSSGPLAHAFGTPRDNVLGLEVVTGTGDIVRAGGRVVKNVAGFDLTRLFTGAWGTLAVITEATVRLRARPERDEIARDRAPRWRRDGCVAREASRASLRSARARARERRARARARRWAIARCSLARLGGNDDSVRAAASRARHLRRCRGDPGRSIVERARRDRAGRRRGGARLRAAVATARAVGDVSPPSVDEGVAGARHRRPRHRALPSVPRRRHTVRDRRMAPGDLAHRRHAYLRAASRRPSGARALARQRPALARRARRLRSRTAFSTAAFSESVA